VFRSLLGRIGRIRRIGLIGRIFQGQVAKCRPSDRSVCPPQSTNRLSRRWSSPKREHALLVVTLLGRCGRMVVRAWRGGGAGGRESGGTAQYCPDLLG